MRTQIPEQCPCGAHLTLSDTTAGHYRYTVHCDDCYDGTEDSPPKDRCLGYGMTPEGAYADWWDQASEEWHIDQMGWSSVTTLAELEKQVLLELDAQRAWKQRRSLFSDEIWFGPDLISFLQTANALSETEGK